MVVLLRLFLIILLIYLLLRIIGAYIVGKSRYNDSRRQQKHNGDDKQGKGVPKDLGEYVDYEDVTDDDDS